LAGAPPQTPLGELTGLDGLRGPTSEGRKGRRLSGGRRGVLDLPLK